MFTNGGADLGISFMACAPQNNPGQPCANTTKVANFAADLTNNTCK